jgi:hypothetical protein
MLGRFAIVVGGKAGTKRLDDVHVLDTASREWLPVKVRGTIPAGRSQHAVRSYLPRRGLRFYF